MQRSRGGQIISTARNIYTRDLATTIEEVSPSVKNVISSISGSGLLIKGDTNIQATLVGTSPAYQEINNYYPQKGKFISEKEINETTNRIVLGYDLAIEIFEETNPLGKKLKFNYQNKNFIFTIIGVMENKSRGFTGDFNSQAYIPITTYLQKISNTNYVNSYMAQAYSSQVATSAVNEIEYFLTQYLGDSDKFRIISQDQILDTINQVTGTLSLMLGGIAAISLLVGGIGIMNIMLVSVTERTREIGIRKALGAKKRHIMSQFLIESITLSGIGSFFGILLGYFGAAGISRIAGWELVVSGLSIIVAVSFAVVIGLFFGIYPAIKAANLDPVESLSYE